MVNCWRAIGDGGGVDWEVERVGRGENESRGREERKSNETDYEIGRKGGGENRHY